MSLALLLKQSKACRQLLHLDAFTHYWEICRCVTPSYMVCHWFPFLERTHCDWACFGETNIENKCPVQHHSGTPHCLQFRRLTWMTSPTTTVGHNNRSVFLLSCCITLFTWMVWLLEGWNSWVFLSAIYMVSAMLHAFLNIRFPVFTSSILFCIFQLIGPQRNQSHNARFKCSP